MPETTEKEIYIFKDKNGHALFWDWLYGLRDKIIQKRIMSRIERLETGNYGDYKSIGEGVLELRMTFGSGYRVYFAEHGNKIIILLCGGDKSTQKKDIETAQALWKEYQNGR